MNKLKIIKLYLFKSYTVYRPFSRTSYINVNNKKIDYVETF